MLTKKRQRKYLAEKERRWLDQLKAFDDSHDQEALHHLRLEIKKIRALIQLSGACFGKGPAKDFRSFKKMFRQAGVIRDMASRLHLLDEHHVDLSMAYRDGQERTMGKVTGKFSAHIRQYRKRGKKAARRLLGDIHGIRTECVRDWYANELIRTGLLLSSSGDQLHQARKKIKALLYVQKMLPEEIAGTLHLDTEYLDQLQAVIGRWHDMVMAVASWTDKDLAEQQAMTRECREKEAAVRALADDFYRRAHR